MKDDQGKTGRKKWQKIATSAGIANKDFPLSSKPEDVARLVYTHYKVHITLPLRDLH